MKAKENKLFNWLLKYFRPHIIKEGNVFYVRKFVCFYPEYLGASSSYWWSEFQKHNGIFFTLEEAEERFTRYKKPKSKKVTKLIKLL